MVMVGMGMPLMVVVMSMAVMVTAGMARMTMVVIKTALATTKGFNDDDEMDGEKAGDWRNEHWNQNHVPGMYGVQRVYDGLDSARVNVEVNRWSNFFLVACTRLYKPLCWSVGPSVAVSSEHAT